MYIRVKLFSDCSVSCFQERLNNWLANNEGVEIRNIQYTVTATKNGSVMYSAMITYQMLV